MSSLITTPSRAAALVCRQWRRGSCPCRARRACCIVVCACCPTGYECGVLCCASCCECRICSKYIVCSLYRIVLYCIFSIVVSSLLSINISHSHALHQNTMRKELAPGVTVIRNSRDNPVGFEYFGEISKFTKASLTVDISASENLK